MNFYDVRQVIERVKKLSISEKKKFNNISDAVLDVIDNESAARGLNKSNKPSVRQTRELIDMVAKRMGHKSSSDLNDDKDDEIRDILMSVINNKKK